MGIRRRAKRVRKLLRKTNFSEIEDDESRQMARAADMVEAALYKKRGGKFVGEVMAALLRNLNEVDVYLSVSIESPGTQELKWPAKIEPWGDWGHQRQLEYDFIVFELQNTNDLYQYLDQWPL